MRGFSEQSRVSIRAVVAVRAVMKGEGIDSRAAPAPAACFFVGFDLQMARTCQKRPLHAPEARPRGVPIEFHPHQPKVKKGPAYTNVCISGGAIEHQTIRRGSLVAGEGRQPGRCRRERES